MSYVHRLTLALKHCWAYLRSKSAARSRPFTSRRSAYSSFASRSSLGARLRSVWGRARAQAQPKMARAQAQAKYAQAQALQMAVRKFTGLASGSKLGRFGVWLGKSIAYSIALSLALSALVFGIGAAVAGHSWHGRPNGFTHFSTVAEIQSSGFDEQDVQLQGRLTNYLYKDVYEFTDELGNSIEVELDDDIDWSPVHKDQLIAIFGEVERNLFKLSIEVKGYRILEEMPQVQAASTSEAAPSEAAPAQEQAEPEAVVTLESDKVEVDPDPVHLSVDEAATGIKLERINYEL